MSDSIPQTPDIEATSPTPIIGDSETVNNKFNWLKNSKNARRNPFVSARPHLTHTQSSSDLLASQSESRSDMFQNSRLNLFDTAAPKPTTSSRYNSKGISLWGSRSVLEKLLLVVCGVLLLLVIILIITVSMEAAGGNTVIFPDDNGSSMCLSSPCIYTASQIIRSLDETKDPCEDFYEFACSGWIKNNPIPDGKANWGIFSKIDLQNQLNIRNALEKLGKDKDNKSRSDAARKAYVFYDACMDTNETIEALGGRPLLDIITELGGWHIIPKSTNNMMTTWKLQSLVQKIQNKYNRDAFFNWAVAEDDRNSSVNVIVFDQSGLTLPTRDTYLNQTAHKKVLDAYLVYMTKVCVLLGATESAAREEMKQVIALETAMANITIPSQDRRDGESLYNPMTISEFQKISSFLNWKLFLNDAFNLIGRKISDKEKIVIYAPEYFKKLSHLLDTYVETEQGQRTITSYLMWQITHSMSSYLSKAFRDATKGLQKALFGSDGNEELWRYCVTETNNALGFAVGAMFVRDVFDGDSKLQAQIMINQIRTAFKDNLQNIDWMDPQTKKLAETKADAITDMIGFPDYILNKDLLDGHYADLKVHPSQYFKNNLEVNKFTFRKNLEKLDEPVNRTKWGMIPSTVNAYYTPTKNQIVFPAGILQLPFYNDENPRSVNYGAMGVVMGHELTHAFDDQGREYDQYGNLNQWWNDATVKQFKQRTECFQKQYSNFSVNKQHLNGKQTLGENIADNGGLKAAYHAYLEYSRGAKVNQTLPGLRYTHTQTFFISFAQVWCSSMTKEAMKLQIEKDDHAVAKYRVIGSLSNLKEFSEQFHCKLGTKMNPKKKCEIW